MEMLGYDGKRVVVTGCSSGMGRAAAELLLALGAQVHGLDRQPCDLDLAAFAPVDLRDSRSVDDAVGAMSGPVDALFNCAGLGPTFPPIDIVKVNFIGTRYLTEKLLPLVPSGGAVASIASTAGMGWSRRLALLQEFVGTGSFEDAVRWAEAHADDVSEGYAFSKEAVIVWTLLRSQDLIRRGIRINCVMPALTQTPMLDKQIAVNLSKEMQLAVVQPMGRPARPEEQAFPLVMINSAAASYINGAALNVDGGRMAGVATGRLAGLPTRE